MANVEDGRGLLVEVATEDDLDAIMEVEERSFAHPWQRQSMVEELNNDVARLKVCREPDGRRIVAFINYWIVADELHVLNVATLPDWRRQGIALMLMEHAMDEGRELGVSIVTLEVRRKNAAAQQLYQGMGFRQVGVRRKYYDDGEDALLFELQLSRQPPAPNSEFPVPGS